jgi:nucleotide-binding universal stress UspA family protein
MYKRILVPLDGSKLAETALPHAESMANTFGAELVLLTVVHPPSVIGRTPADVQIFQKAYDTIQEEAETYLAGVKGTLREKQIKVETVVGLGPVVADIINTADSKAVDLVIIASHGRSGMGRVFFGSVAAGVLNRIEKPLLVIRSKGH